MVGIRKNSLDSLSSNQENLKDIVLILPVISGEVKLNMIGPLGEDTLFVSRSI